MRRSTLCSTRLSLQRPCFKKTPSALVLLTTTFFTTVRCVYALPRIYLPTIAISDVVVPLPTSTVVSTSLSILPLSSATPTSLSEIAFANVELEGNSTVPFMFLSPTQDIKSLSPYAPPQLDATFGEFATDTTIPFEEVATTSTQFETLDATTTAKYVVIFIYIITYFFNSNLLTHTLLRSCGGTTTVIYQTVYISTLTVTKTTTEAAITIETSPSMISQASATTSFVAHEGVAFGVVTDENTVSNMYPTKTSTYETMTASINVPEISRYGLRHPLRLLLIILLKSAN